MHTQTLVQNFGMKGDDGTAQADMPSHGTLQYKFTANKNRHTPLSVFVHIEITNARRPQEDPRIVEKVLESQSNPKNVALFGLVGNYIGVKQAELSVQLCPFDSVRWKF